MTRYWFKFDAKHDDKNIPFGLNMGCGITAYDYEDALLILQHKVFKSKEIPSSIQVIKNIDISTLDSGHILPNIAPSNRRGVWYPSFYDK